MIVSHQQASTTKVRVIAVFLLILEVGIMFAYGFGTYIDTSLSANVNTDNSLYLIGYLLPAILAILGWGLIIAYSQNSAISGLATTLMAVGLTVQLQPLTYAFFDHVFKSFNGTYAVSLDTEASTMQACTSLLVALCFLVGRLGIAQTFIVIVVFNFGWPMSFWLMYYLKTYKWTGQITITDYNGTNFIYVFAGFFALVVTSILNCKEGAKPNQSGSRHSAYIGMIGTGFAFATFPFTGWSGPTIYALYEQALNLYFCMTASVIMTYWSSAAFGNFRVGVRESLVGVLSGGVILSAVNGYINNIGGCIACGAIAGVVSGFWLRVIHPRINHNKSYDHLGLLGPILVNAMLGGAVVAPALFGAYKSLGITVIELSKSPITSQRQSTFYLTINIIAVCIGTGFGLITGILCYLTRNPEQDYQFAKLVSNDFGLYHEAGQIPAGQNSLERNQSLGHLNRQGQI